MLWHSALTFRDNIQLTSCLLASNRMNSFSWWLEVHKSALDFGSNHFRVYPFTLNLRSNLFCHQLYLLIYDFRGHFYASFSEDPVVSPGSPAVYHQ